MNGNFDLSAVARLYTESLEAHGATPKGVGWKDLASQNLRFAKLLEVTRGHSGSFSVNDLGCGYGALLTFLEEQKVSITRYCGVDVSEPMLVEARRQAAMPGAIFRSGKALEEKADFSFASGIFNVRLVAEMLEWETHIEATIANLAEYSTRGFAFNLLTSYADYFEEHLYYGDPQRYFALCKRKYRNVSLLHDYPLYEWTILVRLS